MPRAELFICSTTLYSSTKAKCINHAALGQIWTNPDDNYVMLLRLQIFDRLYENGCFMY
jgi:hypothetical protein